MASKTLVPENPDDLVCDTCPERFPYTVDLLRTFERARVRGWHIYQKISVEHTHSTGERKLITHYTRILCPKCIGTPRSRLEPAPPVLEGQADILQDLGFEVKPVEKEQKSRRAVN